MSGIFGLVRRDGAPVRDALATMQAAMPRWGPDGFSRWSEGAAGLGQARTFSMPESCFEDLPAADRTEAFAFTATGRLDNREALIAELGLPERGRRLADSGVMMAAYRRWGPDTPTRLLGDWSFAAWHPAERRLLLARDQLGHSALYYHCDRGTAAFSSSQRALLALRLTPLELDELYLAQYLISWPAYHGERTESSAVRRLAPAHTLEVTPETVRTSCYWRLEDQPELRMPSRSDYVAALRETFDEAVQTRLRSAAEIGTELSGGLDSSSVAATAAGMLRKRGKRMTAFTSVPIGPVRDDGRVVGNELPMARITAEAAGNIDVAAVSASGLSPIEGIRLALQVYGGPNHAAGNMFWLLDVHRQARQAGCDVLLTGSTGNGGISWSGDPLSQSLAGQLRTLGLGRWLRRRARRTLPVAVAIRVAKLRTNPQWYRSSAIDPGFARRLRLAERRLEDPDTLPRTPLDVRLAILQPGRSLVGCRSAELGAWFGVDVRDPTADARVLSLTLSIPDAVFRSPDDGAGRWLIREAMRDRLPEPIRHNRRHGLQAADLVSRLRRCAAEVDDALDEVRAGPGAAYLDVEYMRETWRAIQRDDTPDTHRMAVSVLTRGIMGGLFANSVLHGELPGSPAADG